MTYFTTRDAAKKHALETNARMHDLGERVRFHATKTELGFTITESAMTDWTVISRYGVECHAPTGFASTSYSGSNGSRDRQRDMVLAYWEAQGMAEWRSGGAGGGGRWYVRDNHQDAAEWLPLASFGESQRGDRAELSHVVSAANGGAWCACGLVAEVGAKNGARGERNMSDSELSPAWRGVLRAWDAYWRANVARKASLARL